MLSPTLEIMRKYNKKCTHKMICIGLKGQIDLNNCNPEFERYKYKLNAKVKNQRKKIKLNDINSKRKQLHQIQRQITRIAMDQVPK